MDGVMTSSFLRPLNYAICLHQDGKSTVKPYYITLFEAAKIVAQEINIDDVS